MEPTPLATLALWAAASISALAVGEAAAGTTAASDRLAATVLQMQPCKNNEDCSNMRHAKCNTSSRQCTCMDGYSPMSPRVCGKKLGDPCDDGCDTLNSRCHFEDDKGVCTCEDGLTAGRDGTFCYGIPLLYGDFCDHNDNCTVLGPNMECRKHTCECKENYVRWDFICKEKIDRLDARCNAHTQVCYVDSEDIESKRDCLDGFCRCKEKFVPNNGRCKEKISLIGAPCNESLHACHIDADGADQKLQCRNGLCQCKDALLLNDGQCKKVIITLGVKCSQDDICYLKDEGYDQRRHCINGSCHCKNSFIKDKGMCKQKISLVGAPCNATTDVCYFEEDGDLQTTHCESGICQCKEEFTLNNRKCKKKKACNGGTSHFRLTAWALLVALIIQILR